MMNQFPISRRQALKTVGEASATCAMAGLLGEKAAASNQRQARSGPLEPRAPHFPAKGVLDAAVTTNSETSGIKEPQTDGRSVFTRRTVGQRKGSGFANRGRRIHFGRVKVFQLFQV